MSRLLLGAAFAAVMVTAGTASASLVSVSGTAGPWDPLNAANPAYGVGDQTAPATIAVNPGDNITITYVSGFTSAFGGVSPTVDATGVTAASYPPMTKTEEERS